MASKDEKLHLQTRVKADNRLYREWEDWEENYEHKSDAVQAALEEAVVNRSQIDYVARGLAGGLICVLVLLIAQVWMVAGSVVAMAVFVGTLIVFGVSLSIPFEQLSGSFGGVQ